MDDKFESIFCSIKKCRTHGPRFVPPYAMVKLQLQFAKKTLKRKELENVTAENNQPHVPTFYDASRRKTKSILNETCQAG